MTHLSFVIPLLNEQDTLRELVSRIEATCHSLRSNGNSNRGSFELLLIDDGSTDGSWAEIQRLAQSKGNIHGIRFRRNFGKAAALAAGFRQARGQIIITMDADLQDDPKEIPRMLEKLDEGFDVVSGWKQRRFDPWHKRWPSKVFNGILRYFSRLPLHDFNCGFKAYRNEVLQEVTLYGEMHRFIPVLAAARGFRIGEITVEHHPRLHGQSKYGWSRIPKGLMDLATVVFLTRFRYRPQHLLGGLGGSLLLVGSLVLFSLIAAWIWTRITGSEQPIHLHERASFFVAILLIMLGIQSFATGLLAELIVANSGNTKPIYSIAESTPNSPSILPSNASHRHDTSSPTQ
jgi:dolichol-phosphate mannosyltransferase